MANWDFYSGDGFLKVGVTDASGLTASDFIQKAGDSGIGPQSFSGDVTLSADPTNANHATRQSYTDGRYLIKETTESDSILSTITVDAAAGGSLLRNSTGDTPAAGEIVWKEWVDNYLPLSGGTITGNITVVDASVYLPVDTLTSTPVILDDTYRVVLVDSSSLAIAVTLPASPTVGQWYEIKDVGNGGVGNASNFAIGVLPGANAIDGVVSASTINVDGASLVLISDGSDWFTVSGNGDAAATFAGLSDVNLSGGENTGDMLFYSAGSWVDTANLNLSGNGRLSIPTDSTLAGLGIGTDVSLFRSNTDELTIDAKTVFTSAIRCAITAVTTATHTVNLNSESTLFVDTSSNAVVVTLPSGADDGDTIIIKDQTGDSVTNPITIDTAGAELINGAADLDIDVPYLSVTLKSFSNNWYSV